MVHLSLTSLVLGLAWLAPIVRSYGIDDSCKDRPFIKASVEAAIDMAAKADEAIGAADNQNRDPNVQRLLTLLFGENVNDVRAMNSIKGVFRAVANFANDQGVALQGNARPSANQVNFYCGLERVQKHANGQDDVDTVTGKVLVNDDKGALDVCKTVGPDLAVTWNPYSSEAGDRYYPSQITICDWFYQWSRTSDYKNWIELRVKSTVALAAIPVSTHVWPFTPIDAINLLDKVLLHEMTHTTAAGGLHDVKMDKDGAPPPFGGLAYGWKAATALAKQNNVQIQKQPRQNSDTYALFGSGIRLLSLETKVYIQDNGWTTTQVQTKRDVPVELQYKRTPAAFEGFMTKIRAERAAATNAEDP